MSWSKFYCFVSGQQAGAERVLLHGAMDVSPASSESESPSRRSAEMRFSIFLNGTEQPAGLAIPPSEVADEAFNFDDLETQV
jgi:hypothetical protein